MQSVTDLENTLIELQWMINNTINPIFSDLQNSSQALDPVILSHDTMIEKINEMILFLNSVVIQGLKGDKGDSGISAYDLAVINGFIGTVNDWLLSIRGAKGDTGLIPLVYAFTTADVSNSTLTQSIINGLSLPLDANALYEIDSFITFTSVSTTTGINLGLATPAGSLNLTEIVVPIANTATSNQIRKIYPNSTEADNTSSVIGTGVSAVNNRHTATIRGYIRTGATAGNCDIKFASEVSGSAVTVKANSFLLLKKIA